VRSTTSARLFEAIFPNHPAGSAALLAWLRELGGFERIGRQGSAG
jgi:hypothetical protein